MTFKYILDDYGNFAIFSEVQEHIAMSHGFYKKPVSAGFCRITVIIGEKGGEMVHCNCFGESISLGIKSRPIDSEIITTRLNERYY